MAEKEDGKNKRWQKYPKYSKKKKSEQMWN